MPMQTISQQFVPRDDMVPWWQVPDTVEALQAELAPPDAPITDSTTLWVLSQPAIRMPLHVHIGALDLPEGTSIMLPSNVQIAYYEIQSLGVVVAVPTEQADLSNWPAPSRRPTTSSSALALERATRQDPQPRMPEVVIDDGFGV